MTIRQFATFFFLCAMVFLIACQNGGQDKSTGNNFANSSDTATLKGSVIEFDTTAYDFGRVYEGEIVGWYFKFRNTGDKSLILVNVTAGCGCTIPSYSKEPLEPGQEGQIKVVFDTNGRVGYQYKSVNVETNGQPGLTELIVTAEVIRK